LSPFLVADLASFDNSLEFYFYLSLASSLNFLMAYSLHYHFCTYSENFVAFLSFLEFNALMVKFIIGLALRGYWRDELTVKQASP
jgi:high-affinity K+ transport system ATPase subunit B